MIRKSPKPNQDQHKIETMLELWSALYIGQKIQQRVPCTNRWRNQVKGCWPSMGSIEQWRVKP